MDQEARLLHQAELKANGDTEAMMMDYDYINAMEEQSKLDTFKEILSKYREIIGVSDENN